MQELPRHPIPKSSSKDMWTPGLVPRSKSTPGDLTGRRIEDGPILVGICAMDQKARSKPMTEMLNRLTSFTAGDLIEFKVVYFGNDTLLNEPIEVTLTLALALAPAPALALALTLAPTLTLTRHYSAMRIS